MYVCVVTSVVLRLVVFNKQSGVNCGYIKTEDTAIAELSLSLFLYLSLSLSHSLSLSLSLSLSHSQ